MSENLAPATETFAHAGRTVSVTMTDPPITKDGEVHLSRRWVGATPPPRISAPTPGFAIYCPASFVVEGLPYSVEFTIDSTGTNAADVVISSMRIGASGREGLTRDGLGSIPAAYLLRAAMNAAAFTVLHYPPNYNGPGYALGDDGNLVEIPKTNVTTRTTSEPFPIRHGGVAMPVDFAKAVSGKPQLVGDLRLQQVAQVVRECAELRIASGPLIAQRFQVTERHARRLVQEAREAGHLDPLPTTDRRTRRRNP